MLPPLPPPHTHTKREIFNDSKENMNICSDGPEDFKYE